MAIKSRSVQIIYDGVVLNLDPTPPSGEGWRPEPDWIAPVKVKQASETVFDFYQSGEKIGWLDAAGENDEMKTFLTGCVESQADIAIRESPDGYLTVSEYNPLLHGYQLTIKGLAFEDSGLLASLMSEGESK